MKVKSCKWESLTRLQLPFRNPRLSMAKQTLEVIASETLSVVDERNSLVWKSVKIGRFEANP